MIKPNECKFCKGTEFKNHDALKVYNPETDEEELINNVYECLDCLAYHFEIEGFDVAQFVKDLNVKEYTPALGNHMKS